VSRQAADDERTLWSFAPGLVGHDDSVKGFDVDARDGRAGSVGPD
jgi:hypothetical protein